VCALVLAGGAGQRIGGDKALLEVDGVPLILRTICALRSVPLITGILVIGRESLPFDEDGVQCVADEYPGAGPLGGLLTGLRAASSGHCLAVGCDMPFLDSGLLGHLTELAWEYDAVVPMWHGHPQPLCTVYGHALLRVGHERLLRGDASLHGTIRSLTSVRWVPEDEVRVFDPEGRTFINVNTLDDLERAQHVAESSASAATIRPGAV
jgi:molybdenum cofactor guanylyltransferase